MVVYRTHRIFTAHICAWVNALEAHACLCWAALIIRLTLAPAASLRIVGISLEAVMAVACAGTVAFTALGVWTTGRRLAW